MRCVTVDDVVAAMNASSAVKYLPDGAGIVMNRICGSRKRFRSAKVDTEQSQ